MGGCDWLFVDNLVNLPSEHDYTSCALCLDLSR